MKINNTLKFIFAVLGSELAGVVGSLFTIPSIQTWYTGLPKPALNPPAWIFAPVWITLFALMGIAAFLVWKKGANRKNIKIALFIFIVQLVLNALWSMIFFGLHNPGLAFIDLIFLWFAILATIFSFAKIFKSAAWLLIPYILWVSFAGYLNYSIWQNFSENKTVATFQYPEKLPAKYISAISWPPQIQVSNKPFSCAQGGSEISLGEKTAERIINNQAYCITEASEGAAGSTYTTYTYSFPKNNETVSFTFILQAVQCDNYDNPQKTACKTEHAAFNVDRMVGQMANSVKFQ